MRGHSVICTSRLGLLSYQQQINLCRLKRLLKDTNQKQIIMTAQEIVLLLSVSVGSLILGSCTARKELIEGLCCHWRAVILCLVSIFLWIPSLSLSLSLPFLEPIHHKVYANIVASSNSFASVFSYPLLLGHFQWSGIWIMKLAWAWLSCLRCPPRPFPTYGKSPHMHQQTRT